VCSARKRSAWWRNGPTRVETCPCLQRAQREAHQRAVACGAMLEVVELPLLNRTADSGRCHRAARDGEGHLLVRPVSKRVTASGNESPNVAQDYLLPKRETARQAGEDLSLRGVAAKLLVAPQRLVITSSVIRATAHQGGWWGSTRPSPLLRRPSCGLKQFLRRDFGNGSGRSCQRRLVWRGYMAIPGSSIICLNAVR